MSEPHVLTPDQVMAMDELAQRSGQVQDDRPLVAFLYLLMRDVVSTGQVEEVIMKLKLQDFASHAYSNGYLASYAQDIADRLLSAD